MNLLLTLFLLIFSSHSMAEWVQYASKPNGDSFFYDTERLERDGDVIRVWTRVRYKTSVMAASSYQNLTSLDCVKTSKVVLQSTFYTDRDWNKPAMATNTTAKPEKLVESNSPTWILVNMLCQG